MRCWQAWWLTRFGDNGADIGDGDDGDDDDDYDDDVGADEHVCICQLLMDQHPYSQDNNIVIFLLNIILNSFSKRLLELSPELNQEGS